MFMDHRADFDERDLSDIESLKEFLDEETYQYVLDSLKEDEEAFEKATNEYERTQDQLFVIDGAEVKFNSHKGEFKVLNDTPSIQGKLVGTMIEKTPMNFTFSDGFQLLTLGEWQDEGTAKFQNRLALIKKSKIQVTGQMPGSTTIESGFIEFETSGQKDNPDSLDFTGTPLSFFKPKPKIINGRWASDKNAANEITEAFLEDTVYFVIDTANIDDGEKLTVQLYDYDHFLWNDLWNLDDKIDNPREVKVKNNQAVIEVYLKPHWKEHIDDEKGQPFANSAIELYWKISCTNKKISEEIYPREIYNHLKVRNQREIYIKPVMSETGYNYGVPEIYSFEGDPMFFADVSEVIEFSENEENEYFKIIKDEVKNEIRNQIVSKTEEKADSIKKKSSSKKSQPIALTRIDKVAFQQRYKSYRDVFKDAVTQRDGKCTIDGKKISLHHDYFDKEQTGKQRELNKRKNLVFQKTFYEPTPLKAKALYVAKDALNIFGDMYDLVQAASSTKSGEADLTSAILTTALQTNFLGGLLTNITLNILSQPMKELMAEGLERDKKELDKVKFLGIDDFDRALYNFTFLRDIYKTMPISYQTMQGLLKGTLKKIENMKSAYKEVIIVYREIEDGILIDAFFVNIKEK